MRSHNPTISRFHRSICQKTSRVQSEFTQEQMISVLVLIFSDSKKYHRWEVSCTSKTTTDFQHYGNQSHLIHLSLLGLYLWLITIVINHPLQLSPPQLFTISMLTTETLWFSTGWYLRYTLSNFSFISLISVLTVTQFFLNLAVFFSINNRCMFCYWQIRSSCIFISRLIFVMILLNRVCLKTYPWRVPPVHQICSSNKALSVLLVIFLPANFPPRITVPLLINEHWLSGALRAQSLGRSLAEITCSYLSKDYLIMHVYLDTVLRTYTNLGIILQF